MDLWTRLAFYQEVETPRFLMRPFRMSDFDDFYAIVSNPQNTAFIFPSQDAPLQVRHLMVHSFMEKPLGIWAITDKETGTFLGAIRLENIHLTKRQAEIGYFVHQAYWGQGVMTECVKTLVDITFNSFLFDKLIIKTHAENRASQRVAQKAGFVSGQFYRASDRYTHLVRSFQDYYLTRKEWLHE